MRLAQILFPIIALLNIGVVLMTLKIFGPDNIKTYMYITHISLFIVTYYYIRMTLKHIFDISFYYVDELYKFNFCLTFFVAVQYWVMTLTDPNSLNDGVNKPFLLDFYWHTGTFLITLLEQIAFYTHGLSLGKIHYVFFVQIALVMVAYVYIPWFSIGFALYPFLKTYTIIEFVLLPIQVILLLSLACFLHTKLVQITNAEKAEEEIKGLLGVK